MSLLQARQTKGMLLGEPLCHVLTFPTSASGKTATTNVKDAKDSAILAAISLLLLRIPRDGPFGSKNVRFAGSQDKR
jgi:hypothetical protein